MDFKKLNPTQPIIYWDKTIKEIVERADYEHIKKGEKNSSLFFKKEDNTSFVNCSDIEEANFSNKEFESSVDVIDRIKKLKRIVTSNDSEVLRLEEYLLSIKDSKAHTPKYFFKKDKRWDNNVLLEKNSLGLKANYNVKWSKHFFFIDNRDNKDEKKILLVINKVDSSMNFSLLLLNKEDLIEEVYKEDTIKSFEAPTFQEKINPFRSSSSDREKINPFLSTSSDEDIKKDWSGTWSSRLPSIYSNDNLRGVTGQFWARITFFFLEKEKIREQNISDNASILFKKITNKIDKKNKESAFNMLKSHTDNIEKIKLEEKLKLEEETKLRLEEEELKLEKEANLKEKLRLEEELRLKKLKEEEKLRLKLEEKLRLKLEEELRLKKEANLKEKLRLEEEFKLKKLKEEEKLRLKLEEKLRLKLEEELRLKLEEELRLKLEEELRLKLEEELRLKKEEELKAIKSYIIYKKIKEIKEITDLHPFLGKPYKLFDNEIGKVYAPMLIKNEKVIIALRNIFSLSAFPYFSYLK